MKLKQISEVIWQMYDGGRPTATNQTLEQDDMQQLVFMNVADQMKMRLYESRKSNDGEKTDFLGGLLSSKQYDISDTNYQGRRSAVYKEEVIRLPKNSDVTNVYLVADNCDGTVNGQLTQVQPGEENFYINDPNLKNYLFFVQKGDRIDTYNVPPCVKKIEVERAFMQDDLDIPLDVAYNISVQILGVTLKMRGFIPTEDNPADGNRSQLRYQLEQQEKKSL